MKKTILLTLLLLVTGMLPCAAQKLTAKMEAQPGVLAAQTRPRRDNSGNLCALIQVSVVGDYKFTGNIKGDCVRHDDGYYWVYVSATKGHGLAKSLHVVEQNNRFLPLDVVFKDYGIQVEPGRTYLLTLTEPAGSAAVPPAATPAQPSVAVQEQSVPAAQPSAAKEKQVNILTKGGRGKFDIYIDDVQAGRGTALKKYTFLQGSSHTFRAENAKYLGSTTSTIFSSTQNVYIPMKKKPRAPTNFLAKKSGFSADVSASFGMEGFGFGISAHAWINRFDIEVGWRMLREYHVYAAYPSEGSNSILSYSEDLDVQEIYGKFGYGFPVNRRIRITPQVGVGFYMMNSFVSQDKMYPISLLGSCRCSVALCKWLHFFVTPEFSVPIFKPNAYKDICDYCKDAKHVTSGVRARIGFSFGI